MTGAFGASPKLRFPHFGGDWVAKRGGDAFDQRRERGEDGLPLYSVTIERGIVRRDSLQREISSALEDEGNLRIRKDDLAYNMMRMWQGAVGRAAEDGMVSPAYVVLSPKPEIAPAFFEHWFKRARSLYLLWAYSYGLTNDRLRLYYRDFAKVPMVLPSRDEQQKIADFLGAIDERIALLARKADALTRYRREVARRLFTRELRFHRNDGTDFPDWERAPLRSVVKRVTRAAAEDSDFAIDLENIESESGRLLPGNGQSEQLSVRLAFEESDVLFAKLRPYLRKFWIADRSGSCSSEIWVLRSAGPVANFLYHFVQTDVFVRAANQSSGSKMPRADWSVVSKILMPLPHVDEQIKISSFLSSLDDKIDALRVKVAAMQTFKKGLLQQMFV